MEYEEEENGVPGNTPEFGAIFMSNAETKRECFKRRVFALPLSMSGFVKQIKSGMVLFLFEFEKRKLYGVYKATCDGALNILPNVFRSGGKQFPSQVSFVPIWDCSPLSENEFRSAICENYYSSKRFKFGLSEDQVRRLLQLFSTRRLNERSPVPERRHTRTLGQFSSGRGDQIDYGRFCTRESVDTKHSKEGLTQNIMNEYLENMEGRSTKIGDVRFCRDDRIKDEENFKSDGQRFLTDRADASLHKKRKISDGGLEANEPHAPLHPFWTDSREASMLKERMPASSGKYLGAEDRDDGWNTFSSPPFGTRYPELPFNLPKATDERHYANGTNRIPIDDYRFLLNNSTTTESGLHNSHRPVSDEQEPRFFDRPGKIADDCEILRNSEVGHNHHMDDGIAPVFPSESFGTPLHTVRGTAGHRLHFTNERVLSEHGPDRGQMVSSSFSQKVLIPLDSHERNFDEQRYPRNNLVKSNFMDGHEGSAINMSSGYDTRLERNNANDFLHHIGTLPRPVISTKSSGFHHPCRQSSLECYTKPSPDSKFPGYTMESQNLKASSSIFHDSAIVRSTLSDVPSVHHVRDISFAAHQGARVAKEPLSHHSEVNIMGVPKGKSFEGEASNTYKASCFGNKVSSRDYNYSAYPTDDIYRDVHLKSPSPDYKSYQFSPASLHDLHSREAGYFDNRDNTLSIDDNHELGQRLQNQIPRPVNDARKYICQQENDEVYAGNEHVSTYPNLSELDMYYSEKDPFSRQLDHSRGYRTSVIDDFSDYYKSSEGPHPDSRKHSRTSVFERLTSGPKPRRRKQEDDACFYDSPSLDAPKPRRRKPEDDAYFHDAPSPKPRRRKQEDDAYFYDAPSVDDVMEMLHQNQNVQVKNPRKFKSVVRQQHDGEEEKEKNYKKISLEHQLEHDHPKIVSVEEVESETNPEIQQVIDDKPKETRMVEFKRRREVKKSLDEKTLENTPMRKEEGGVSEENDKQKSTLGKQEKRRKLVRPNF